MTDMSPGWQHDPAPPNPADPTTMRYWDGRQWTAQVRAATKAERAERRAMVAEQRMAMAAQQGAYPAMQAGYGPGVTIAASPRDYTPDGQALAGWWSRVGATFVDWLLLSVVSGLLSFPFTTRLMTAFRDLLYAVQQTQPGQPTPDLTPYETPLVSAFAAIMAVSVLTGLIYNIGFLMTFSATPGKMALGLEVRLRDRPGPLTLPTVLGRWLTQNVGSLLVVLATMASLTLGPVVFLIYLVTGSYTRLDELWPLWDGRRQALHDKVAGTNVVRRG